jgi:hypothetical protein
MLTTKTPNGIVAETMTLTEMQLERAIQLYQSESKTSGMDSLVETEPYFIETWTDPKFDLDEEVKEWFRENVTKGADIYTYKEGWQEIGEVVFK